MGLMIHPKDRDGMFLSQVVSRTSLSEGMLLAQAAMIDNPKAQALLEGVRQSFIEKFGVDIDRIEPAVLMNTNARAYYRHGNTRILLVDVQGEFARMRSRVLKIMLE